MKEIISFELDEFYLDLQERGNSLELLSEEEIKRTPYPGLRPFGSREFQLFKGRKGQAAKLIDMLNHFPFLAVIGNSGSGKSSLVRAGLIPSIYSGYLGLYDRKWDIAIFRPGVNPILNLAASLSAIKSNYNMQEIEADLSVIHKKLDRTSGISKVYSMLHEGNQENEGKLVVIVDQFEEIFRYQDEIDSDGAYHFIDLLISAIEHPDIYVIVTMRSEKLGLCTRFSGLAELFNKGQYLVPYMKREELREAIEEPARLAGKALEPQLVNRLIKEAIERKDELPIVQHALMRTYQKAVERELGQISMQEYVEIGETKNALNLHANYEFEQLNDLEKELAKTLFQRITQGSDDETSIRRPSSYFELLSLCKQEHPSYEGKEIERSLLSLIDQFRKEECAFLRPPYPSKIKHSTLVDITHESLMRNWEMVKEWAFEEENKANYYLRLEESRLEIEEHKNKGEQIKEEDYLSGPSLDKLKKMSLNLAWACRYHNAKDNEYQTLLNKYEEEQHLKFQEGDFPLKADEELFNLNHTYLQECIDAEAAIIKRKFIAGRRFLWLSLISAVVVILLGVLTYSNYSQADEAKEKAVEAKEIAVSEKLAADSAKLEAEALEERAENIRENAYQDSLLYAKKMRQIESSLKDQLAIAKAREKEALLAEARATQLYSESEKERIRAITREREANIERVKYVDTLKKYYSVDKADLIINFLANWKNNLDSLGFSFNKVRNALYHNPRNPSAQRMLKEMFFMNYLQELDSNNYLFFTPNDRFLLKIYLDDWRGWWNKMLISIIDLNKEQIIDSFRLSSIRIKDMGVDESGSLFCIKGLLYDLSKGELIFEEPAERFQDGFFDKDLNYIVYPSGNKYIIRKINSNQKKQSTWQINLPTVASWKQVLGFEEDGSAFYIYNNYNKSFFQARKIDLTTGVKSYLSMPYDRRKQLVLKRVEPYSADRIVKSSSLSLEQIINLANKYKIFGEKAYQEQLNDEELYPNTFEEGKLKSK